MRKVTNLTVMTADGKILLGMKKRGFGVGKWNGFGGKVAEGESIVESVCRELEEESSLIAESLEQVGLFEFRFDDEPLIHEVHVFRVHEFSGEPAETEEMLPQWFDLEEIPYESMWPDDIHWLPRVLTGEKLQGNFHFRNDQISDFNLENATFGPMV